MIGSKKPGQREISFTGSGAQKRSLLITLQGHEGKNKRVIDALKLLLADETDNFYKIWYQDVESPDDISTMEELTKS